MRLQHRGTHRNRPGKLPLSLPETQPCKRIRAARRILEKRPRTTQKPAAAFRDIQTYTARYLRILGDQYDPLRIRDVLA